MRQSDPRPWLHDILEAIVGYHRVDDEVIYVIVTRQLGPLETAVRRLLYRLDGGDLS